MFQFSQIQLASGFIMALETGQRCLAKFYSQLLQTVIFNINIYFPEFRVVFYVGLIVKKILVNFILLHVNE